MTRSRSGRVAAPAVASLWLTLILGGCSANWNTVHRTDTLSEDEATVISVDAKQRTILTAPAPRTEETTSMATGALRRFCSEPSPDAFSVIAQSLGAGGNLGTDAHAKTVQAAFELAFSRAEQGATIPRSQTVNLLREMMFRTCERFLSGAIDGDEFSIQAARDMRMAAAILAIEQLTGTVTPPPPVIIAASSGTSAAADAIASLDNARTAVDKAKTQAAAATAAYDEANKDTPKCDAIKDGDDTSDERRAACKTASDNKAAAAGMLKAAQTHYDSLVKLAGSGSTGAATPGGTISYKVDVSGDLAARQTVAKNVVDIVTMAFNFNEVEALCIRAINKNLGTRIADKCLDYLIAREANPAAARDFARNLVEKAKAIEAENDTLFPTFRAKVTDANGAIDPTRLKKALEAAETRAGGIATPDRKALLAARTIAALRAAFGALTIQHRQALGE